MHIVFVVDTSASMNQRVAGGITILDCAKAAIEHFVKVRARDQYAQASGDKYFLLTTDEHPTNGIKFGWKENLVQTSSISTNFLQEVKNIVARDFTNIGLSIKRAFDTINMYRLQNNVDNYAQGRFPSLIGFLLSIQL